MKRAALYLRVSTNDQTTANQQLELERVASAKGWRIVQIYEDAGISGSKGRGERAAYDQMLKDAVRAKFEVVLAWDVSRLGRSLSNLVQALEDLQSSGIDLYLHQQALDTTTASGKALFQMCGVFAEFEKSMISERVKAGLSRARESGTKLGRPTIVVDAKRLHLDRLEGLTMRRLAVKYAVSLGTIYKLLK